MENNNILDVNEIDFETKVLEESTKKLVVVDFWAPWCGCGFIVFAGDRAFFPCSFLEERTCLVDFFPHLANVFMVCVDSL